MLIVPDGSGHGIKESTIVPLGNRWKPKCELSSKRLALMCSRLALLSRTV